MGMGKTGSSALQVAFVRNRDSLIRADVNYPVHKTDGRASQGKVVSGNGMGVVEAIAPRQNDVAEAHLALQAIDLEVARGASTTLYSSELLFSFSKDSIETLLRRMEAVGVELQAVIYVRNMAGHAVSSYAQAVKRRLYTGTFRDYIDRDREGPYRPSIGRKLQFLHRNLGESLRVVHYDSVRDQLVGHFFSEILGADLSDQERTNVAERINRSLTRDEVELMRHVNTLITGKKLAHVVGDLVIEQPPLGERRLSISTPELKMLDDAYGSDFEWINSTFFPATRPLSVESGDVSVLDSDDPEVPLTDRERFLIGCLADLVRREALG